MILQITTTGPDDTEHIAESIGRLLKGGETVELVSDLGGGKTTFVRGLARGAGSMDKVASPSFTISRVYEAGEIHIHHFDFYRLEEPGVVGNELAEAISDPRGIVVIEWSNVVQNILPPDRITITITRTGDESRSLVIEYPQEMQYVIEGVRQ